ncbi:NAD(P)-binding domain-containing protein [Paracoccaceae bacterium]|nr:NAD(P)-binding domain-containing protein [Paracoccaceae bacterium]
MNVGFIGTGEIAEALIEGITGQGHKIYVSNRSNLRSKRLSKEYTEVIACENDEVCSSSDIIFICLMAPVARAILPKLNFRIDHQIISVMAHINRDELISYCLPAKNICITIPLPFVAKGGCPLPVYPHSDALKFLYGANNSIIVLESPDHIAPHFVISAMLSPVFSLFDLASKWLGSKTGNDLQSEIYLTHLFKGYLDFMPDSERERFTAALHSLSTEGGLNSTLKAHMQEKGTYSALSDGLALLEKRLGIKS